MKKYAFIRAFIQTYVHLGNIYHVITNFTHLIMHSPGPMSSNRAITMADQIDVSCVSVVRFNLAKYQCKSKTVNCIVIM